MGWASSSELPCWNAATSSHQSFVFILPDRPLIPGRPLIPDQSLIVVLSGPGGVGKGTIAAALVEADPRLWLSRSWTTRQRRPGEPENAYEFVSDQEFRQKITAGGFVEWAEIASNLYGTPQPEAPAGHDVLLEIDVQGAAQVRQKHPEALCIFVEAPSVREQESRLRERGDPESHIFERLALAPLERIQASELNAIAVVNDTLEETVSAITKLLEQARQR